MRRVIWTDEAVSNLESIATYVGQFSPLAAQRLAVRLKSAGDSLVSHPDRGRLIRLQMRELTVIYPYLIRYRLDDETIVILRVRHGAREPD